MVFQASRVESLPRADRLIRKFRKDNTLQFLGYDASTSRREDFEREILQFNPNIVFLPHPDTQNPEQQNLYRIANELLTGKIGISYETPDINEIFNLYVFFDEAGMKHKMRCLSPFKSQLKRVRFDLAAKYAVRAAAEEIKTQDIPTQLKSIIDQYPYAERFVMAGFLNSEDRFLLHPGKKIFLARPGNPEFGSWDLLCGQKAAFYSPHHDDLEIPAAFTMSEIARQGTLVHNLVLSTGKEGVAGDEPWIEKLHTRFQELAEASRLEKVVPINLALFHDYPETRPQPGWISGAEKILYGYLERFNPRVIFLPLKDDAHPDHKLTYELVMEIAGKAYRDGHWSEGAYPNVIFYASPWYSGVHGTNAYYYFKRWTGLKDEAARYAAQVNAIVGTELAMNRPGTSPPKPEEFGGKYAERFLIQVLCKSTA